MATSGSQRKLGYYDVIYNIKQGKFFAPMPGDNYYELDVETGGGAGGTIQNSAQVPLANPTRFGRADSTGLKTQADFNNYINTYVAEVEAGAGGGGAPDIAAVLAEGDRANGGQRLRFSDGGYEYLTVSETGIVSGGTIDSTHIKGYDGEFRKSVTAVEFIGDGSKLTNLPSTTPDIAAVLNEGGNADPGQELRFEDDAYNYLKLSDAGITTDGKIEGTTIQGSYGTFSYDVSAANFVCDAGGGLKLKSPNGTEYMLVVADDGTLSATAV